MLGAALTTAATWHLTSASALTRSRSAWSMMAMSPGSQAPGQVLGPAVQASRSRHAGQVAGLDRRAPGRLRFGAFIG